MQDEIQVRRQQHIRRTDDLAGQVRAELRNRCQYRQRQDHIAYHQEKSIEAELVLNFYHSGRLGHSLATYLVILSFCLGLRPT